MPNQCPFPVRSTDSRRCYRAGGLPGCTLGLALIAALLGYAGFSHGAPLASGADAPAAAVALHAGAAPANR